MTDNLRVIDHKKYSTYSVYVSNGITVEERVYESISDVRIMDGVLQLWSFYNHGAGVDVESGTLGAQQEKVYKALPAGTWYDLTYVSGGY